MRRIGQPISITLTDEQRAWVDAQIPPGETRTQVVRALIQAAMTGELGRPCETAHCYRRRKPSNPITD